MHSIHYIREQVRLDSLKRREISRSKANDLLRLGLGEIQKENDQILTIRDIHNLAGHIKRHKHATQEDLCVLNNAFLQDIHNIREFTKIPGAIQVLIKEMTGNNSLTQVLALECICNLSLGEVPVCDKITQLAGSYLITYLDSSEERLTRTSIWTITNIIATTQNGAKLLINMELVPKLWKMYAEGCSTNNVKSPFDYRQDAGLCLQLLSLNAKEFIRDVDLIYLKENFHLKAIDGIGSEYHLQILLHLGVIARGNNFSDDTIAYLVNFSFNNILICMDSTAESSRLRIISAIRILANLLGSDEPRGVCNALLQSKTVLVLNKIFSFNNEDITRETFWLLRNFFEISVFYDRLLPIADLMKQLAVPNAVIEFLSTV